MSEAATSHVLSAIALNARRLTCYARQTRGRSVPLSVALISLELTALPLTICFDLWALPMQRQGAPVIRADFVPMSQAPDWRLETTTRQRWDRPAWRAWRAALAQYMADAVALNRRAAWRELAARTAAFLSRALEHQRQAQVALPMAIHLLESIGLGALHALDFQAQTQGRSVRLYRAFLRVQLLSLATAWWLDRLAQRVHALGAGMIANDVPAIPFEAAWAKAQATWATLPARDGEGSPP